MNLFKKTWMPWATFWFVSWAIVLHDRIQDLLLVYGATILAILFHKWALYTLEESYKNNKIK